MNSTVTEASPELLQSVLDHSLTNIYAARAVRDATTGELVDFKLYFYNSAFLNRVRLAEVDVQALTLRSLFPVLDQTGFFERYRQVVETGEPFEGEQEYPGPNGHFWYQTSVKKLDDGIVVNFIDITNYKQARQQAQAAADMIETIVDNVPVAISLLRPERQGGPGSPVVDLVFERVNATAARMRGLPIDQMEGQRYSHLFPQATADGGIALLNTVLAAGQPQQYDVEFRADELNGWFEQRSVPIGDQIILFTQDITARKQTELRLQQSNQLLQATLDASISSILAMTATRDERGRIVDFRMDKANRAVERSLSRTPEELEGRMLLEVFPGNVENGFFDLYAKAADTGTPQQATLHYTDVNGFEGWFEVSAVQQRSDGTAQDKIVLTFMNVTESKQIEQRLRESNTSLDQFAAIASHDLQEPLRKIKSFGDMLLEQYGHVLGDGLPLLRRMHSAADRMQILIRDLLAYSRLSTGRDTDRQPIDLGHIVDEVLIDLEMVVAEKQAVVEVGDLPSLPGDALQLRQVVQNLFSNALKFAKTGQPPRVTVTSRLLKRSDLPADLVLTGKSSQVYWKITVTDNGIGFSEVYREKIFGAFERLHGRSSQYGGTGIGLAIVRKIMENHNGAVRAHSQEGEGSTFILYLPASA